MFISSRLLFASQPAKRQLSSVGAKLRAVGAALLLLVFAQMANSQPATEPLLERSSPVKSNVLYVLDNSGSMFGTGSARQVYSPQFSRSSGTCGDNNYANLSPFNNSLHYNPAKRYIVGRTNAGDPQLPATVDNNSFVVTYIPRATATATLNATTNAAVLCTASNYDRLDINANNTFSWNGSNVGAANPFPKSAARTDCPGTTCTIQQERQNVANWRAFHINRIAAAKTGSAEAFSRVPTNFRLSYGSIHSTATQYSRMRDFDQSKGTFMTWLNGLAQISGTPLRQSLDAAGQFYSDASNTGPWGNTPWAPDAVAQNTHLSCRRSYTILVTDGEWNGNPAGTAAARNDVDSTSGTLITHADGQKTYRYVPRSSDARSIGKADKVAGSTYSDTLSDVAMYYWSRDLRTDLPNNVSPGNPSDPPFWQNMTTYTGAFGPVGRLNNAQVASAKAGATNWVNNQPANDTPETIDDLIHAAHNAGGRFLNLTDADSFADELSNVIGSIANQLTTEAGVAASSVSLTAGTRKFVPTYNPVGWWGNVKAITLNANGSESGIAWEVTRTSNGRPTGASTIPAPSSRNIYVNRSSTSAADMIEFKHTNLSVNGLIATTATPTSVQMASATTDDIVQYLRGVRTKEGSLSTDFRVRDAVLGDIVNSTPAFIKNSTLFNYSVLPASGATSAARSNWPTYLTEKAAKTEGILLVGANDGMLHVFREGGTTPGAEILAVIPRGVLSALHTLPNRNYQHRFFVDGPLSQHDAYIDVPRKNQAGTTLRWANIVTGTAGAGGRSVFAIDGSWGPETSSRAMMWEVNSSMADFANLGYVMNEVQTGVLSDGTWVAVFGNGSYGGDGRAYLYVVNLSTGALIKSLATDTEISNGLGGVRLMRNNTGILQGVYAGDLKGRMWRFDLLGTANTWTSNKLFTTSSPTSTATQPITAAPAVFKSIDGRAGNMIVFGTGKLHDSLDQFNTTTQSAYGIWDNTAIGSPINGITGRSNLVSISVSQVSNTTSVGNTLNPDSPTNLYEGNSNRAINWSTDRGWVLDYTQTPGQRTIYPVEVSNDVVRIDSVAPRLTQASCSTSSSLGFNFIINPFTGTCNTNFPVFDTNGDGVFNEADSKACIYSTEADGRDVVLTRREESGGLIGITEDSCLKNLQNSQGFINYQDCKKTDPPPPGSGASFRRDWRQLFPRN